MLHRDDPTPLYVRELATGATMPFPPALWPASGAMLDSDLLAAGYELLPCPPWFADYAARRAAEYPPLADLADAVAKQASADPAVVAQGQAQQAAYQTRCLAVKAKYPKPPTPAEVPHAT